MREEPNSGLRFGRSAIIASDIAQQYYCEKKVEMGYLQGEIENEDKILGRDAHENLLEDAVEIKREELWKKIYGKTPLLALEVSALAKYQDVFLAGKFDLVLFQKGYPIIVFEFKFSKRGTAYMTHHVQVKTYGLILENMGFNTSKLFYALIVADPKTKGNPELQQQAIDAIFENGFKENILSIEDAKYVSVNFTVLKPRETCNGLLNFGKRILLRSSAPKKVYICKPT